MCTVSIKVDEDAIREYLPELDSTAAIRMWAQMLIDARIRELANEENDTLDIEEARAIVLEAVREEYAKP